MWVWVVERDGQCVKEKNTFSNYFVIKFTLGSYTVNQWLAQVQETRKDRLTPLNGSILSQGRDKSMISTHNSRASRVSAKRPLSPNGGAERDCPVPMPIYHGNSETVSVGKPRHTEASWAQTTWFSLHAHLQRSTRS